MHTHRQTARITVTLRDMNKRFFFRDASFLTVFFLFFSSLCTLWPQYGQYI